jgi:hypothetical protein
MTSATMTGPVQPLRDFCTAGTDLPAYTPSTQFVVIGEYHLHVLSVTDIALGA